MTVRPIVRSARCSACGAIEIDTVDCGAALQIERLSCGLIDVHAATGTGWIQIHLASDAPISVTVIEASDGATVELDRDDPCRCGEE